MGIIGFPCSLLTTSKSRVISGWVIFQDTFYTALGVLMDPIKNLWDNSQPRWRNETGMVELSGTASSRRPSALVAPQLW